MADQVDIHKVRQYIAARSAGEGLIELNPLETAVVDAYGSPSIRGPRTVDDVEWVELPTEHEAKAKTVALRLMQDFYGAQAE